MRLAACALFALVLAACAQPVPAPLAPSTPTQTPSSRVTVLPAIPHAVDKITNTSQPALVQASPNGVARTLHPYPDTASYTSAWNDVAALIWGGADGGGGLLAFDWTTLSYRPAIAREMPRVSDDGKTFVFALRPDVKWSDSSPITADDFVFAYEQASREDNHYVQLDLVTEIASYVALDAHTLQIMLRDAKPRDLALGIANVVTPVPKAVWTGRSWTDATQNPEILRPSVVLGPFRVVDFKNGESASLAPVDTFYAGRARVPRIDLLATDAPFDALRSGSVNWVRNLPPAQYAEAKGNAGLSVQEWSPANAAYRTIEFNVNRPLLSDRRIRQALSLAVNRSELIVGAEQGLAVPQSSFIQPGNEKWLNAGVERYAFDLARARALLSAAGYQAGSSVVTVVYPSSSAPRASIAAYLQKQWSQLGIGVDLQAVDFATYTDRVQNRHDFDVSLATYGGGALDPDLGPKAQLTQNGAQNATGYSNPRVDELFRLGSLELNESRRKQLYDEAQQLVADDVPMHYLYALKTVDAFTRQVHGPSPTKSDRLDSNSALLSWTVSD